MHLFDASYIERWLISERIKKIELAFVSAKIELKI